MISMMPADLWGLRALMNNEELQDGGLSPEAKKVRDALIKCGLENPKSGALRDNAEKKKREELRQQRRSDV